MSPTPLLARELALVERSVYLRRLGIEVAAADLGNARAFMPYRDEASNRGGTIHGGAMASVMLVAASLAAASSQRPGPSVTGRPLTLAASFLRAPRGEGVGASARVLHRGRDTVHVAVQVETQAGAPAAVGEVSYRVSAGDDRADGRGASVPVAAALAERVATAPGVAVDGSPYLRAAEMETIETLEDWAAARLPLGPNEGAPGHVHEGALAGLADTCGAFASYKQAAVSRAIRGVTVALHMSFARPAAGDVAAAGRLLARSGAAFSNDVQIWSAGDDRMTAAALVGYRIA